MKVTRIHLRNWFGVAEAEHEIPPGGVVFIARRASKGGVLVVDGLERLDPEQEREFLRAATKGGCQVIGTRVRAGAIQVEAIEADEEVTSHVA